MITVIFFAGALAALVADPDPDASLPELPQAATATSAAIIPTATRIRLNIIPPGPVNRVVRRQRRHHRRWRQRSNRRGTGGAPGSESPPPPVGPGGAQPHGRRPA